ncbi:hypothetical protein [Hydrogenophaga sp. T2]|uniref:hypothetical protein n=1 Tax=Hydrogenophaga sp. T2 TaxID=3132823 RepID=UPI003CE6DACA
MLGLMYLGAAALYLSLMFFVVRWAWRRGRQNDGSVLKSMGFGALGFLAVYLLAFWNVVPSAVIYRKACEQDAGFQAFIDPKDWVASHQVRIQELRGIDPEAKSKSWKTSSGFSRYEHMGGLLADDHRSSRTEVFALEMLRSETRIVDAETDQVLAQAVDYSLGTRDDARIWLTRRSCFPEERHPISQLIAFNQQLKGALK